MPQFISQQDARSARPNPVADITISVLKKDLFTWRSFWMLIVARGLDRLLADRSTPSLPLRSCAGRAFYENASGRRGLCINLQWSATKIVRHAWRHKCHSYYTERPFQEVSRLAGPV